MYMYSGLSSGSKTWLASSKKLTKGYGITCAINGVGIDDPVKSTHQVQCNIWGVHIPWNFYGQCSFEWVAIVWFPNIRQLYATFIEKFKVHLTPNFFSR